MAEQVTMGAEMMCSFGLAPSTLVVLPHGVTVDEMPAATIMDHVPIENIEPFGECISLANPEVAAATAAALGVLTPMPCIPVTTAPWIPGSPGATFGEIPTLNNESTCLCDWGGVIEITSPGAPGMTVP